MELPEWSLIWWRRHRAGCANWAPADRRRDGASEQAGWLAELVPAALAVSWCGIEMEPVRGR